MIFDSFADPLSQPLPKAYKPAHPSITSSEVNTIAKEALENVGPGFLLIGVQYLGRRRHAFSLMRAYGQMIKRSPLPNLKPKREVPFTHPVRQGMEEVLERARTTDLPQNFIKPNPQAPWLETIAQEVQELQNLRKLKKIHLTAAKQFAKNFEKAGLILFGLTATLLAHLQNKDKSKKDQAKAEIKKTVEEMQQKGQELSIEINNSQDLIHLEKQLEQVLSQLPEGEKIKFLRAQKEILVDLTTIKGQTEKELNDLLSHLQTSKEQFSSSALITSSKDIGSTLASVFLGLSIALIFNRLPAAKTIMQQLVQMGVPKVLVDKMIVGLVSVSCQEALLALTSQNVTKSQIKLMTDKVLKQLDIEPQAIPKLSNREEKLNNVSSIS